MRSSVLENSSNTQIGQIVNWQVQGNVHQHRPARPEQKSLAHLLRPIRDASHRRNRMRAPPDSTWHPDTRPELIEKVESWSISPISTKAEEPHMFWMHGCVGSGKSSVSQEICDRFEFQEKPVVSFFFFQNEGPRGCIWRVVTTLAFQMAEAIPAIAPFVLRATENGSLLNSASSVSVGAQLTHLFFRPFKMAWEEGKIAKEVAKGPVLVVIDGLDECENRCEVQELLRGMLTFFKQNSLIPLRIFITSRPEQHIKCCLDTPGSRAVRVENLMEYCTDSHIAAFMDVLFKDQIEKNDSLKAYVERHGDWPTPGEKRRLVEHIGGSFIFASAVFKFITERDAKGDALASITRLPQALNMNVGLDGLYRQTLARSETLPYFSDIISTIALLRTPLPASGIAELLEIETYDVINVLSNLQAIIQLPGSDDGPVAPVTVCHTSLRDFLTTENRSRRFYARPSFHVRLFLRCLHFFELQAYQQTANPSAQPIQPTSATEYSLTYQMAHLQLGEGCFDPSDYDNASQLLGRALDHHPHSEKLIDALAEVAFSRFRQARSTGDLEKAISWYREVLELRPASHPDRPLSLNNLGNALLYQSHSPGFIAGLDEAISLYREAVRLRTSSSDSGPSESLLLNNLANAILDRYRRRKGAISDLDEAISLYRKTVDLRPWYDPDRSLSLNNLGNALLERYRRPNGSICDLEEAIIRCREALDLRPSYHPDRSLSLSSLGNALLAHYQHTGFVGDLERAVSHYEEVLELRASSHPDRPLSLNNLSNALLARYRHTQFPYDLEMVIFYSQEALKLDSFHPPDRSLSHHNLGHALLHRHRQNPAAGDLEGAISHSRKALELRPLSHPERPLSLICLGNALLENYRRIRSMTDLDDAIGWFREAAGLEALSHSDRRSLALKSLADGLLDRYHCTLSTTVLEEAISHYREALNLRPAPHLIDRWLLLNDFAKALLERFHLSSPFLGYQVAESVADLKEAISTLTEAIGLLPENDVERPTVLTTLVDCLQFADALRVPYEWSSLEEAKRQSLQLARCYPWEHEVWKHWMDIWVSLCQITRGHPGITSAGDWCRTNSSAWGCSTRLSFPLTGVYDGGYGGIYGQGDSYWYPHS